MLVLVVKIMPQQFYGCLLYADDIILLSHSLNAMRFG